ncbi:MAG: hypothetical protein ASARMPRED_004713 [Alectoria sarmentosa]|nr:MAG: hypothetical protein ASARMPRED_004713 [Alectoria sarmentosa]
MPKNGNRGANTKKTNVPLASNNDIDSNVVFGDTKTKRKATQGSTAESSAKKGGNLVPASNEDTPKKLDSRELIGGASSKTPEGFSSMVILKATNPRTKETLILPSFKLPPSHKHLAVQQTALEARHFAATFALFRVCSMRNIHMMLPPIYRDLWKTAFQDLKSDEVKQGNGWMYEADPFAAKQEREEAQTLMAKKRDERAKQKAKEADQPAHMLSAARSNGGDSNRNTMKGWARVPNLDMAKRTRAQVESLVRRDDRWNIHAAQISEFQCRNIINEFVGLGFRKSHVEEAIEECKDREETLEWLIIHVPEDDLPSWVLPGGYTAGLSMASSNLKREASIKRLAEAGYSNELCARLLDDCHDNESIAAEALQNELVHVGLDEQIDSNISSLSLVEAENPDSIWTEEQETLKSIFCERFKIIDRHLFRVQLHITELRAPFSLSIRKSRMYPQQPPTVSIISPGLPAYIRLSIIRQLIKHANAYLLGEPMIFNVVDWLENNIPNIVNHPGRLRDVSVAVSGSKEKQMLRPEREVQARVRPTQIRGNTQSSQNLDIFNRWQAKQATPQQQRILAARQTLPAWKLQEAIVNAVGAHQVTIISGETGSGKSTQCVQFVLDDMIKRHIGATANLICTQPRRISALGLADRVSDERCSRVGDEVGYAIRGESKQKSGTTKITFVTTGVLLRRLQTSGGTKDDIVAALADVSHVVVDEVHERSLDVDFLLVLLKEVLSRREDLKVILMSATLDAGVFEKYFSSFSTARIEIQGRTYPVEDFYLDDVIRLTGFTTGSRKVEESDEDDVDPSVASTIQGVGMRINYNLIASTVRAIDSGLGSQEGGILIFLPGTMEINRTLDALRGLPNIHALPLHASLIPTEQRRVFPPAPRGKRKVVVATNVAETSITIEDIVAVIDCGKVKETSFDPQNNMVKLEEVWASRAACKQRRGRAGRVQAGVCYKLYTRNAEDKMAERPEPEIRRVPLEQLCLSVRAMGVTDVPAFLASALTPPEALAVQGAVELLGRMGALDGDDLTALGRHLSMIPADLRCGKLMVYGATFGCLEACLIIAAILTVKSPFVSPQTKREDSKAARLSFAPGQGDLICDLRAYEEWAERKSSLSYRDVKLWCDQNYLSNRVLDDISSNRSQYLSSLTEAGFLPSTYHSNTHASLNAQGSNHALVRALVAGAFNPQLARIDFPDKKFAPSMSGAVELDPEARTIKFFNQDNGRVFVHPSSTLFDAQGFPGGSVYLSYFNKMETKKLFIREVTPFNAYSLLLFSGPITLDTLGRGLIVDGWLRLRGWARIGVLVSRLRMMLDEVLAKKIDNPSLDVGNDEVVAVVRKLVEFDGLDR